jgi:hypothetical protein
MTHFCLPINIDNHIEPAPGKIIITTDWNSLGSAGESISSKLANLELQIWLVMSLDQLSVNYPYRKEVIINR